MIQSFSSRILPCAFRFRASFPRHGVTDGRPLGVFLASTTTTATIDYELIQDPIEFVNACRHLEKSTALGFDIECDFNLYRYGTRLCLVQLSDGDNNFIMDPNTIGDMDPLWRILENPAIQIICHSPRSDFFLLNKLYGLQPRNVFCTEMAARLLGYQEHSLSDLLRRYTGRRKQSDMTTSNWNQRPIPKNMLKYAALDVAFLHDLRNVLVTELQDKRRLDWHKQECLALEDIRYIESPNTHLQIKGSSSLDDKEAHVLKHLFVIRENVAKKLDKPPCRIIANKMLIELSQSPPTRLRTWKKLKGVHPCVRKHVSDRFHRAVLEAMNSSPASTQIFADQQVDQETVQQKKETLHKIRAGIERSYPDIRSIILSKRTADRIATGEIALDALREWQRSIVMQTAQKHGLDMSLFQ